MKYINYITKQIDFKSDFSRLISFITFFKKDVIHIKIKKASEKSDAFCY